MSEPRFTLSGARRLGVCYYPEQWPEGHWKDDARRMSEIGISVVRIGEFAWSRLEPRPGHLKFDWLERAIDTLAAAGHGVVLGTPTATPPKWMVDADPSMLAVDECGQVRGFGSRRHYCFSSRSYRRQCQRMVGLLAERFGQHEAVIAWQTDNEYGCHDTILSYSNEALLAFRAWCQARYGDIDTLNQSWGNVFWSMEYGRFEEIDLPIQTVTESNPAHRLAFWRFSSDQVREFNRLQVEILREKSPGRDLMHNYMGHFLAFDHHLVAEDLDVVGWDNYPLGFLDRDRGHRAETQGWLRTGHPDDSAFHHDLYRGMCQGRFWIIEQQPGPVNWAPHNPSPLPGMIRLWAWEAFAHGAELMSWFRWRQAPFAQEQLHTGLCRFDGEFDSAVDEVRTLHEELTKINGDLDNSDSADVAIVFDYAGDQLQRILRIGGDAHEPLQAVLRLYSACRAHGVNVDVVSPSANLDHYQLVLVPNRMQKEWASFSATHDNAPHVVFFPGSMARDPDARLLPGAPIIDDGVLPVRVTRSESVPDLMPLEAVAAEGGRWQGCHWRERIDSPLEPHARFGDGWGLHYQQGRMHYLNAWLRLPSLTQFIADRLDECGVSRTPCTEGLRLRRLGSVQFAFNYGPDNAVLGHEGTFLLGSRVLPPASVAAWRINTPETVLQQP